ncbi:MAG: GNAT family N-acetyltransferase, partial [Methylobacteriaceae bacterium]|nr:GNAT family N-acetyltransferase [Methylobacteriaceae bacterium]
RPAALADFLSLEAAGWKGRRGTALASRPGARTYAEALFGAEGGDVGIRIDRLVLEGRTIAASLALVARGTAYLLKTAYDESLARFAPGLLLERAIIRACHETGFADALDTTAEEETGPFAELYPDRMTVVDLLLSPDGAIGLDELARIAESELQRRLLRNRAVGLYWAARDRLATLRGGAG